MNGATAPTLPRLHRGFTLIELLVVISIIALLIGILLPALAAARGTAQTTTCNTRIKQIVLAANMYASENKDYIMPASGKAPTANTWGYWHYALLPRFLDTKDGSWGPSDVMKEYLECPSDKFGWSSGATTDYRESSYGYSASMGTGYWTSSSPGKDYQPTQIASILNPTEVVITGDSWHNAEYNAEFGTDKGTNSNGSALIHYKKSGRYPDNTVNAHRHAGNVGNAGFVDGHAETLPATDMATINADDTALTLTNGERVTLEIKHWFRR